MPRFHGYKNKSGSFIRGRSRMGKFYTQPGCLTIPLGVFVLLLLMLFFLLVSCQPSPESIQNAIFETQTAFPTSTVIPTPTLIPIKDIDLSKLIDIPHGLPTGFDLAQIRSDYPSYIEKFKVLPINSISQYLEYNGKKGGYISVYIYDTYDQATQLYDNYYSQINGTSSSDKFSNIGEKSFGVNANLVNSCFIVFVRCNAFVDMSIDDSNSYYELQEYAKVLDTKISESFCQ
jgi:hypothetical protein